MSERGKAREGLRKTESKSSVRFNTTKCQQVVNMKYYLNFLLMHFLNLYHLSSNYFPNEKKNVHTLSSPLLFPRRIGSQIQALIYQTTVSNQLLLVVYVPERAASSKVGKKNVETLSEEPSAKFFPVRMTIQSSHHASNVNSPHFSFCPDSGE